MAVYVDKLEDYHDKSKVARYWCHLYADTLDELHAMADEIGLQRSWFQNRQNFPHYDLTARKRELALKAGAIDDSDHKTLRSWIKERIMSQKVSRAKFRLIIIEKAKEAGWDWSEGSILRFSAVVDGSEENKRFFEATPSGDLTMHVNATAAALFEEGAEYYLDFTKAEQNG